VTDLIEEWRPVPGHPAYEVSSLARVRSWKRKLNAPHLMRPHTHRLGYKRITIDGRQIGVHQLVAAAWHGPCPDGKECDHINNVRDDNRPENLRYLTRQENLIRRRIERAAECSKGHPLSGDNLYVRPGSGRRDCRICQRYNIQNRPQHNRRCTAENCSRMAECRLRTDQPVCEMHYQRSRTAEKRRREAAEQMQFGAA
jgi:hypothetical protein